MTDDKKKKKNSSSDDGEVDNIITDESSPEDDSAGEGTTPGSDEIVKLRESLARSQADYQNLLKRNERDRDELAAYLSVKLLLPLLTQVDNLERAVKLKEGVESDTFVDGIRTVLAGMHKYLESQKVLKMSSLGAEVDPMKHEVMTEGPGEDGKITQEFESGYMIGDRVLRHAKVVVGNGE